MSKQLNLNSFLCIYNVFIHVHALYGTYMYNVHVHVWIINNILKPSTSIQCELHSKTDLTIKSSNRIQF